MCLARLNEVADKYKQQVNAVMRENYTNVWKGQDNQPIDQFSIMVRNHDSGKESDFNLSYKISTDKSLVKRLFEVTWELPFHGYFPQVLEVSRAEDEREEIRSWSLTIKFCVPYSTEGPRLGYFCSYYVFSHADLNIP